MKKVCVSRPLRAILSPLAMTFSFLLVLAGCGTVGPGEATTSAPTVSITASPASITAGGSSTLTVVAGNATQVTVTGSDGSNYSMAATGGTKAVSPATTTTYTVTAAGSGGTTTATVTLTVAASPTAPKVTITASPTSITAGQSSTLTVVSTNATQVTVTGSDGSSYSLGATGGTKTVSPTATTTYTATATGTGGTTTAAATVTVSASPTTPTVTITANPVTIAAGNSSTLTVAAANATTVTVTGSDGSSYTMTPAGGTKAVTPAATTTYTATASGPGGTATAMATVTVTPAVVPPTVTIAANPTTITAGSNSTLTVVAANATTVVVTGTDGSSNTMAPTGGTLVVTPAATTTYTVTASSGTLQATATATVTVVPAPPPTAPTITISANPTNITAGASSTLTVVATNATSVVLTGTDGTSAVMAPAGGTQVVSPTTTAIYNVTATGAGGSATATVTVTVTAPAGPAVTIAANPASITSGAASVLTVTATNATSVTMAGTDGSNYTLAPSGGTQSVTPTATTTYTATANGATGTTPATAKATVTVVPSGTINSISHVIFMLQENHSFDDYFGMLNPYRQSHGDAIGDDGVTYDVDGIEDKVNGQPYNAVNKSGQIISNNDKQHVAHTLYKFKSTCIDDMSSAWTESFGDVALGDYPTTRTIRMNGFVSNADGFANSHCAGGVGPCTGYTDTSGDRAMGYYDDGFLNYYYYMASQFALSDRWFSPIESKSIPNRIATFTGGTTQGLTQDPSGDDHLNQLNIKNIFQELDTAATPVSWKVYYTVNNGECDPEDCKKNVSGSALFPSTTFSYLTWSFQYLYGNPTPGNPAGCRAPASPSSVIGDTSNTFCINLNKIAPLNDPTYGYFADLNHGTLPSFSFIESGSGLNDEHPGFGQSILAGQAEVAKIINGLMTSTSWQSSAFFLAYDEGGGPYDHVPPVPSHTNDFTTASMAANYPIDVTNISISPDSYNPCVPAAPGDLHCDLKAGQPGSNSGDDAFCAPGTYCPHNGFGAQLGFRVPNMVVSPFARRHYVSHVPMDHTAVIKFVENRFLGPSAHLTLRDAAQPDLLDFFDFTGAPWATPPTQTPNPPPTPAAIGSSCQPTVFH
jgi:phospholipase C